MNADPSRPSGVADISMTGAHDQADRFGGYEALKAAHSKLLSSHHHHPNAADLNGQMAVFIQRAKATGVLLDDDEERYAAQTFLNYWSNVLSRAGHQTPDDVTLADYDSSQAPSLADQDCPYIGLDTFDETRRALFFGWKRLIAASLEKLRSLRLLALTGAAGSGRSSLIRGALLPALNAGEIPGSEKWRLVAPFAPGAEPLKRIAVAIFPDAPPPAERLRSRPREVIERLAAGGPQPTLMVVDQFEELFTLAGKEDRDAFLEIVVNLATDPGSSHRVIIAVRSDYLSHFAEVERFLEIFQEGQVLVAFDTSELRQAIEGPARTVGLKFDDGLIDRLLLDIQGDPAALTLLQFTLLELWDHRQGNRITRETYRKVGGGRVALERAAESLYAKLSGEEKATARRILLLLVQPGVGQEVRCLTLANDALQEPGEPPERTQSVIDKLVTARLLRRRGSHVSLTHESLVSHWARLLEWVEEARVARRRRLRFTACAYQWRDAGEEPCALLSGASLLEAQKYAGLDGVERLFIDASKRAEGRRRNQKRLLVVAGFVTCILGVLVVGYFLWRTSALLARMYVERGAALVQVDDNSSALHWFVEALGRDRGHPRANGMDRVRIAVTLAQTPKPVRIFPADARLSLNYAELSPDGRLALTISSGSSVRVWNVELGKVVVHLSGHEDAVTRAAFDSTGRLVTVSEDRTARIWDARTGALIHKLSHGQPVKFACFSPEGERIVTVTADRANKRGEMRLWNAQTGEPACPSTALGGGGQLAAFSGDGELVATASIVDETRGSVALWNARHGEEITPRMEHDSPVSDLSFNPGCTLLVTASGDPGTSNGKAQLWRIKSGTVAGPLLWHEGVVTRAAFSPDGRTLLTASLDSTVKLWDLRTAVPMDPETPSSVGPLWPIRTFQHDGGVYQASFSPDGRYLVTGSRDQKARIWDIVGEMPAFPPFNLNGTVSRAQFTPDCRFIFAATGSAALMWEFPSRESRLPADWVNEACFNLDGTRSVTAEGQHDGNSGVARIWDLNKGEPANVHRSLSHESPVLHAAFAPSGEEIVTGCADGSVRIWRVTDGAVLKSIKAEKPIFLAAFSYDGASLLTVAGEPKRIAGFAGCKDALARVFNVGHWEQSLAKPIALPDDVYFVALSPDSALLVAAGGATNPASAEVRVWDARTGDQKWEKKDKLSEIVTCGAFSPDNRWLVTGSIDDKARLWDAVSGRVLLDEPLEHKADLTRVGFSHDGRHIVTASRDGWVKIWDSHNGTQVAGFKHQGDINQAFFSADDLLLVTASSDGTARLWDPRERDLVALLHIGGDVRTAKYVQSLGQGGANRLLTASFTGSELPGKVVRASWTDRGDDRPLGQDWSSSIRSSVTLHSCDVSPCRSSLGDLRQEAQLHSARRFDHKVRNVVPVDPGFYSKLDSKLLSNPDLGKAAQLAWHKRQASDSELEGQDFSAAWHLTRMSDLDRANAFQYLERRARAFQKSQQWENALGDYRELLKETKDGKQASRYWERLAELYSVTEKWMEAVNAFDNAIRGDPNNWELYLGRGRAYEALGEDDKVLADYSQALPNSPNADSPLWERLAFLHLKAGDHGAYRSTCQEMIKRFRTSEGRPDPRSANTVAWACALGKNALDDYTPAIEFALEAMSASNSRSFELNTQGAILFRAGQFEDAVKQLKKSIEAATRERQRQVQSLRRVANAQEPFWNWVFLAMAEQRLGHEKQALDWLDRARMGAGKGNLDTGDPLDWLTSEVRLLLEEAEALIPPRR